MKLVRDMAEGVVGELRAAVGTHPGTKCAGTEMAPIVGVRYEVGVRKARVVRSICEEYYNEHWQGDAARLDPYCTGPIAPLAGPVADAARAAVDEGLLEAHTEGAWYNDDAAYSAAVGAVLMLKQELSRPPCASMLRV